MNTCSPRNPGGGLPDSLEDGLPGFHMDQGPTRPSPWLLRPIAAISWLRQGTQYQNCCLKGTEKRQRVEVRSLVRGFLQQRLWRGWWGGCWRWGYTRTASALCFYPWVGKIPWRRQWQLTPVSVPGESHGQKSLAGYSPWDHKESDMTERLTLSLAWKLVATSMLQNSFRLSGF